MSLTPRFSPALTRISPVNRLAATVAVTLAACGLIYAAVTRSLVAARAASQTAQPARVALEALGASGLRVKLQGGEALAAAYTGDATARHRLEQNLASPLALASADFDEDGMPDLVTGYGYEGGGVLSIHRGNFAALYPNHQAALDRARLEGAGGQSSRSPFLAPGRVWPLERAADFVAAGDFDADGHFDVVVAARRDSAIYLLAGDGKGNLGEARRLALPGRLTSLAAGEVNRADGLADLALGVETDAGAKLAVYESPAGAWRAEPEVFNLSEQASAIALGRVDRDAFGDVAAATGGAVSVVRGRDRRLTSEQASRAQVRAATVERVALPGAVRSLAVGSFTSGGRQVAALLESGAVHLVAEPGAQSAVGRRSVGNRGTAGWQTDLFAENVGGEMTALVGAKVSTAANDDLLAIGEGSRRLEVVARHASSGGSAVESGRASFELDGALVGALPMRLNGDAMSDLVVLRAGSAQPAVVESAPEATFTVTNPADFGTGTLRDAIDSANRNPGPDVILFSMSGSVPQTITLSSSPLPAISEAVTIDATSQPGFAGQPVVQLSHGQTFPFNDGLTVGSTGGGTTIRGFVINGFVNGVRVFSSNNVIEGNYIGTDPTGTQAVPNSTGVSLNGLGFTVNANRVGGTTAAARNVISGNSNFGVAIFGGSAASFGPAEAAAETASANLVYGNFIGVDVTGNAALANDGDGVYIADATANLVGDTTAGARNVISANDGTGVEIFRNFTFESTAGNLIQGNFIGLNAAGTAGLGNVGDGVVVEGNSITVGGTSAAARNVISGNGGAGVEIGAFIPSLGGVIGAGPAERGESGARVETDLAQNTLVQGNYIGTDAAGTGNVGNSAQGVAVGTTSTPRPNTVNNTVGGTAAGAANVIAFNSTDGVALLSGSGNAVLSNSIFNNGGLGILRAAGANNDQAAPALTSAVNTPTGVSVTGSLQSTPNTGFTIQFFSNQTCDPSGFGEGQTFIGSTAGTTDANGLLNFVANLTATTTAGQIITATATSAANNTSAFSNCQTVEDRADLALTLAASPPLVSPNSTATFTITLTNNGPSNANLVTVTASLSQNLTNVTCTATNGGVCSGTGTTRTITFGTLSAAAPNNTSIITLTGMSPCALPPIRPTLTVSATMTSRTPDPNAANNAPQPVSILAEVGSVSPRVTLDSGPINLGPVVAGSVVNPPSATLTIESVGCLPLALGPASFRRNVGEDQAALLGSLDDSRYFRLAIVNPTGPDTLLTPDSAGNFAINRSLQTGQTLRLRVTFAPPLPNFAGRFAGRTGTLTAAQFLPDTVNSRLLIPYSNISVPGVSNQIEVSVTGRVSPQVQLVSREGFTIPQSAATGGATEAETTPSVEAASPVLLDRVRDEFRVAVSLYDPNLNVTRITYQFFDTFRQPASDPIVVTVPQLQPLGLLPGQAFTVVQAFTGAAGRPDITSVRVTVEDGDGARVTGASSGTEAAGPGASPATLERASDGSVIYLPNVRLDRGFTRERRSRTFDGGGRMRKE
jgi:uncharacterized repeat protein (TIGR01451 family)